MSRAWEDLRGAVDETGWGEEGFGVKWETGRVGPLGLDQGAATA